MIGAARETQVAAHHLRRCPQLRDADREDDVADSVDLLLTAARVQTLNA